jgi:predicted negative regulator of RcsB-dependent stress response
MALQLDLEEQEQLDKVKDFWSRYGDYVVWTLIVVLAIYASWNGWQYWQRRQAAQAAVLFETVERAAEQADLSLLERSLGDIQSKFGSTTYASQGAFLASKVFYEKGQAKKSEQALEWVAQNAGDQGYQSLAKLRLSALHIERGDLSGAKTLLTGSFNPEFQALVEDRLADINTLEKATDSAKSHYLRAWAGLESRAPYKKVVEAKLNAIGIDPTQSATDAKALVQTGSASVPASSTQKAKE